MRKSLEEIKQRELKKIEADIDDDIEFEKEIRRIYRDGYDEIETIIDAASNDMSENGNISFKSAYRLVSAGAMIAFQRKVNKQSKEKDFSERAKEETKIFDVKKPVSRIELLKNEVGLAVISIANEEEKLIKKRLEEAAEKEAKRQAEILSITKEMQKKVNESIKSVINNPTNGNSYSERIWNNQKLLQYELNKGIQRSIMAGENPKKWAKNLKQYVRSEALTKKQSATYMANRIAITETAMVQTQMAIKSFQESGYKKYIWIAEPTACKICIPHHLKVFDIEDAIIGIDAPPMHPFCRCSIAAYFGDDV